MPERDQLYRLRHGYGSLLEPAPQYVSVDLGSLTPILSVSKNFKLTERMAFGVGANFYNVFNHPNFDQPDATFGDPTFGQMLSDRSATDQTVRSVLRQPAFGTHYSVPGQAGVLREAVNLGRPGEGLPFSSGQALLVPRPPSLSSPSFALFMLLQYVIL